MRASLTIEDKYAKTINWLGRIKQEIPILRIATMRQTKGQLTNDVRLVIVPEIPLAKEPNTYIPKMRSFVCTLLSLC